MAEANAGMDRRAMLAAVGTAGLGALTACAAAEQPGVRAGGEPVQARGGLLTPQQLGWDPQRGEYVLPDLPYPPDALEPHIDADTMRLHHGRHHRSYVDGMNKALRELANIRQGSGDESLVKHYSRELSFNGSGHTNHTLFWLIMAPEREGGGRPPSGPLAEAMRRDFGSLDGFRQHFKLASTQVEGSGWGWLVYHPVADKLMIIQGEKQQDTTIYGTIPLMGVDVWEHAYYLRYQNRRAEYVDAFINVVNWARVGEFYNQARQMSGRG